MASGCGLGRRHTTARDRQPAAAAGGVGFDEKNGAAVPLVGERLDVRKR